MDSLTLNNNTQHLIKRAPSAYTVVPHRWRVVLDLHLAGHSKEAISKATGYTVNSIYRILNHKDVQLVRQQLMESTQQEFEALFSKVVTTVRTALDDPDPKVGLMATAQWLKASGKGSERGNTTINVTAEDVVMQMLNGDVNADTK